MPHSIAPQGQGDRTLLKSAQLSRSGNCGERLRAPEGLLHSELRGEGSGVKTLERIYR